MLNSNNLCRKPYPLGAHVEDGTVRFSFVSKAEDCGVLIYDKKSGKKLYKLPFTQEERIGNVHCKYFDALPADAFSYQFYEADKLVPDRHARMFVGNVAFGKERKTQDLKALIPAVPFDWEGDVCPKIPYHESLCYVAHVRGFTKHASSKVVNRGTFAGMVEKLDYLKQTGVTAVELQPAYEFTEIPTVEERLATLGGGANNHQASDLDLDMLAPKKCNYWGYKHGYYYAPKASYAAGEDACVEFKEMVRAFHKNNMEVIMQFYFPKTVKSVEIIDILKYWVLEYHVDGFHLMGENLPVDFIASDEMLSDTKLWYYHFDTDRLYESNEMPAYKNLAAYNDEYLYAMRKFLKGDENMLGTVISQMREIPNKCGKIHYMSNYFGMTLMDMVSYDRKHNEANGEDNRDGNDFNFSWNCGEEGPSRRKKVQALRRKQIKNAMFMLLLTQSTPLIFMGDEFGNSQKGNNNPYCQDNAVTWLDWNDLDRNAEIYAFWKNLVTLRKEHAILHPDKECRIMDYLSCGYPDLSYHGESAWRARIDSYNRHIGVMHCGKYAGEDTFFYLAFNMYWETRTLALPKLPQGMKWQLMVSTNEENAAKKQEGEQGSGLLENALKASGSNDANNVHNANDAMDANSAQEEKPKEMEISVPARSCAIYVSVPDLTERKKERKSRKKADSKTVDSKAAEVKQADSKKAEAINT